MEQSNLGKRYDHGPYLAVRGLGEANYDKKNLK
jgi:hypothetical protein